MRKLIHFKYVYVFVLFRRSQSDYVISDHNGETYENVDSDSLKVKPV